MKSEKPVLGHIFLYISGLMGLIVFKNNRIDPWMDPHQPREFYENWFETATCIRHSYTYRVGQKLLPLGSHNWVPPEQFFAVSSKNTDFLKKLFNMEIFSIIFVIKRVIFGVRWPLLRNAHIPQNFFGPCVLTFGPLLFI